MSGIKKITEKNKNDSNNSIYRTLLNNQRKNNLNNINFNNNQFTQTLINIENSQTTTFKSQYLFQKITKKPRSREKIIICQKFELKNNNGLNYLLNENIIRHQYQNDFKKNVKQKNINNNMENFNNENHREGVHKDYNGEENVKTSNNSIILSNYNIIRNNNDAIKFKNKDGNLQNEIRMDIEDLFDQLLASYPIMPSNILDNNEGLRFNSEYLNYSGDPSVSSC